MKILFEDNHILVASADDISSADAAKHIRSATGKEGAVFVHMLTFSKAVLYSGHSGIEVNSIFCLLIG